MTSGEGSGFRPARAVAAGVLSTALRAGLGLLLVVAGLMKLRAPAELATEIANYHLLPALAPYLGATLPAMEVVVGVGLVALPVQWRRAAALVSLGLFSMFAVAVGSVYFRGINVACGCFGGGGGPITGLTLLRNLALLSAAGVLCLSRASVDSEP